MTNQVKKRCFLKIYHQHGSPVNDENQSIKLFHGENSNYMQRRNAYLDLKIRVRKADNTKFIDVIKNTNEVFRLVKNAFVFTIHDARISTSSAIEIEQN